MITLNHSRKFLGLTGSTRRLLFEPASDGFDEDDPGQKAADRPYLEESTFNTNMLLILAALLCFLICAMGLHSIVRCVLRCTRWQAALFVPAEDMEAVRVGNTGMNRKALRALPTAVYGGGGSGSGRKLPCSTDCPICLAEFVEGEKVRVLPKCNHAFHIRCIDTWLASHSSCPTCRQNLLQLSHGNNKNDNEANLNMSTSAHSEPLSGEEALQ